MSKIWKSDDYWNNLEIIDEVRVVECRVISQIFPFTIITPYRGYIEKETVSQLIYFILWSIPYQERKKISQWIYSILCWFNLFYDVNLVYVMSHSKVKTTV